MTAGKQLPLCSALNAAPVIFIRRGSSQQLHAPLRIVLGKLLLSTNGRENHRLHDRPPWHLLGEAVDEQLGPRGVS